MAKEASVRLRVGFVCMHGQSSRVPMRFFQRFLSEKGLAEKIEAISLGIVLPDYVGRAKACDVLVSFEGVEKRGDRVFEMENGRKPLQPLVFNPAPEKIQSFLFAGTEFYACDFDPSAIVSVLAKKGKK